MSDRPNILLFIADGMQAQTVLPGSQCLTPNFERLASRGIRFRRATCATPTCSPSRASLMTGLLPHNHGVLEVEHGRDPDQCVLRAGKPHFARKLVENGYATGYFGKWHVERTDRLEDFGWQVNGVKSAEHVKHLGKGDTGGIAVDPDLSGWIEGPAPGYNRVLHYGVADLPPEERHPRISTDQALDFLGARAGEEEPWCCCVSFSEPNEALVVSRETFEKYDPATIDLPANRHDEFLDKPNWYRRQKLIAAGLGDAHWRMARTCYYGRITELDDELGRLLDFLDRTGQSENTIVIATADHGRYVGAHGFDAHNVGAFEEIYGVPMIVAGPGVGGGVDSDARVQFPDLCPTLLELTGSEPIESTDFRSFVPVLRDPEGASAEFDSAYGEYHGTRFPLCQRILWEGDWKFVFNGFDFDELYDLESDPGELTNLAARPEHSERVNRMMAEIWRRAEASGDRAIVDSHYFSMRIGRVGPQAKS